MKLSMGVLIQECRILSRLSIVGGIKRILSRICWARYTSVNGIKGGYNLRKLSDGSYNPEIYSQDTEDPKNSRDKTAEFERTVGFGHGFLRSVKVRD